MNQGCNRAARAALAQHPRISTVGFTGSLAGGRAVFDLCAQRPDPIPFFGEIGSVNPMFILPTPLSARAADIAQGWSAFLSTSPGQFCTNLGVAVVVEGPDADTFAKTAVQALEQFEIQTMPTNGIMFAYAKGCARIADCEGVQAALSNDQKRPSRQSDPVLHNRCHLARQSGPVRGGVRSIGILRCP